MEQARAYLSFYSAVNKVSNSCDEPDGEEPAPLTAFNSGLARYLNYKASIKKATLVRFLVLMWPKFIAMGKEN